MKKDAFNMYTDRVCRIFGIDRDQLFKKSKVQDIVDARHLLYYLCYNRPMTIKNIQNFLKENGYDVYHQTVIYGIDSVKKKVESDVDYSSRIAKLSN
jgi:chromosomal replication initiation ATPase DnaA